MAKSTSKALLCRFLALALLTAGLFCVTSLVPHRAGANTCDASALLTYCASQGRNADYGACDCNPQSCFGVFEQDCAEQGLYLNYNTCQCEDWVLFENCTGAQISSCSAQEGTLTASCACDTSASSNLCSFNSYVRCNNLGGLFDSFSCACSFPVTSNGVCTATGSTITNCELRGGQWNSTTCSCN